MKATLFTIAAAMLAPMVASAPVVDVKVSITDDAQHLVSQHSAISDVTTTSERIPGWVFLEEDRFIARIHGNTFWTIKGKLSENFALEDFLFDPILITLNHPEDFAGDFNGTVGRGQISLEWPKSGATILGRSPIGDFEIKGNTKVDYSP